MKRNRDKSFPLKLNQEKNSRPVQVLGSLYNLLQFKFKSLKGFTKIRVHLLWVYVWWLLQPLKSHCSSNFNSSKLSLMGMAMVVSLILHLSHFKYFPEQRKRCHLFSTERDPPRTLCFFFIASSTKFCEIYLKNLDTLTI